MIDRLLEKLPDHVALLLIVLSGFLLARVTWSIFPADPNPRLAQLEQNQKTNAAGVSLQKASVKPTQLAEEIAELDIFGRYQADATPATKPEPVASKIKRPDIKLVGVYALPQNTGVAVIEYKGKQHVLGVGEAFEDKAATLTKVEGNSIELSWDEEKITYELEKGAGGKAFLAMGEQSHEGVGAIAATPRILRQQQVLANNGGGNGGASTKNFNTAAISQTARNFTGQLNNVAQAQNTTQFKTKPQDPNRLTLENLHERVMQDNTTLLQVIRPTPVRRNGQFLGYRLRPGASSVVFRQLGFRSGDIVTSINGIPLSSQAAGIQAIHGLAGSRSATLTLLRAGRETQLTISL